MAQLSKNNRILAGVLEIILSAIWLIDNAYHFYDYTQHPNYLRIFILPDWLVIARLLIGLIGIYSGIQIIRGKWTVLKAYMTFIIPWILSHLPVIF